MVPRVPGLRFTIWELLNSTGLGEHLRPSREGVGVVVQHDGRGEVGEVQ